MAATKTINDRSYSFGLLVPTDALRVEIAVVRVIGEPLFKAFTEVKKKPSQQVTLEGDATGSNPTDPKNVEDQQRAGMAAMGMLASRMDADDLLVLFGIILKTVTCDGQRVQIDVTFMGRNRELWQVIIEALKVNFSDFFPADLFASFLKKIPA